MPSRRAVLTGAVNAVCFVAGARHAAAGQRASTAHAFSFSSITGDELALADFAGRPVLVVNTASRCGYTGQYSGLQELWDRYAHRGLVVLGVPSDDFNQELATEDAVKEFCELNYGVEFPMTAITSVKGRDVHPFYAWAAREAGAPRWNFHKYLIGPDGRLAGAYATAIEPTDARLTGAIEELLPAG